MKYFTSKNKKAPIYTVEVHPFKMQFIPEKIQTLIIGTFPTNPKNYEFAFFYAGKDNLFWEILQNIFGSFKHFEGEKAIEERENLLTKNNIGVTDMISKCYRKDGLSTDENIYPILYNDILKILKENESIEEIIFTSRTEVIGALGHFMTYCMQNNLTFEKPKEGVERKVLEGVFKYNGKVYNVLVPYSPSPRLIAEKRTTIEELISMYSYCLK